jgi:hypothetical protein
MAVWYEWVVEEYDTDSGDIADTLAWATAADAIQAMQREPEQGHALRLCLTRQTGDDAAGMTGRSWAYVDMSTMKLPDRAEDGDADGEVPARYHKELAAAVAAHKS